MVVIMEDGLRDPRRRRSADDPFQSLVKVRESIAAAVRAAVGKGVAESQAALVDRRLDPHVHLLIDAAEEEMPTG